MHWLTGRSLALALLGLLTYACDNTVTLTDDDDGDIPSATGSGGSLPSPTGGGGATPPPPPDNAGPGDGSDTVFAVTRMYFGDTDSQGSPSPTAWKAYGYNLDGKISTGTSTDLCKPSQGAAPNSVYPDGNGGIDNSWGKNLLPIWTGLAPDFSAQLNDSIASGEGTFLIKLDDLGSQLNYSVLGGKWYLTAPYAAGLPKFDGTDAWDVSANHLASPGDVESSLYAFTNGYLTANTWVAAPAGDVTLTIDNQGFPFAFELHHAFITMVLSPDHQSASNGIIAGVIDTEQHVDQMRKLAGSFDPGLCEGTTFESLADQLRQASDILKDGTQDPTRICDGISIGIGFEAVRAQIGDIAPATPPPPDPCGP
ncbi:hypothetical protein JYT28_01240 [Desulfobulbus sp. AH-315-M07]|nr:hypothetical protein [Desulfobulbus sp. AH-315-M07]